MKNTLRGAASAAALAFLLTGTGAASAIPEPGPARSGSQVVDLQRDCPLERLGTQLVRCDNLTGAGVIAPPYIPVQGTQ